MAVNRILFHACLLSLIILNVSFFTFAACFFIASKLPFTTTDWTCISATVEPSRYTLQVKRMPTLSPNDWTFVSWIFDTWCYSFKGRLADSTDIIIGIPRPFCHGMKSFYSNAQSRRGLLSHNHRRVTCSLSRH
jgi:hypothetical protein